MAHIRIEMNRYGTAAEPVWTVRGEDHPPRRDGAATPLAKELPSLGARYHAPRRTLDVRQLDVERIRKADV